MSTPLLDRLRSATHDAHAALEDVLALLQPPLQRERFVEVLRGFLAFHQVWEPAVAPLIGDAALLAPRGKIPLIEHDLHALKSETTGAIPPTFDLSFLHNASAAWGSLYVMEGSTLGGQVISKALRREGWAPADGLGYFNPYGRRTAAMWAGFRAALEAAEPALEGEAAAQGARATFHSLQTGLAHPMDAAA